ncbi:phasin family protein [Inquilinus limosus]|uniref:Phasin n=1 Tax=Inquilinus limosus TaxID=171674 RepID=A0A211ZBR9_9PROT|nr:phasin family protein [Inquilinus limosus]OWJ62685.1 phasin [Inquilinus limosus]
MSKVPPVWDVDFTKLLGEFKVPGVDLDAVLQAQRKNIEALTAANRTAAEGVQAFARRQGEIIRQNLAELQAQFTNAVSTGAPEEKLAKQTELAKVTFEKAIADMKELAELLAKSNTEAAEIVSKRVSASFDELKGVLKAPTTKR